MKKFRLVFTLLIITNFNVSAITDSTLLKVCFDRNTFDTIARVILLWDSSAMQHTMLVQNYHRIDSTWINDRQHVFTVNNAGDTIMFSYQSWFSNAWEITSASTISYDSTNYLSSGYSLHFNGTGYDTTTFKINIFDSSWHIISDTSFNNNSGWQYYSCGNLYYDSLMRLDSSIYFLYDSMQWQPYSYLKLFYDSLGRKSMRLDFAYVETTATWDSLYRTLYKYDDINNSDTIIEQSRLFNDWYSCYDNFNYRNYDVYGRTIYYYLTCCACGSYSSNYYYIGTTDSLSSESFCNVPHGGSTECDSCIYYYQSLVSVNDFPKTDNVSLIPNPACMANA